MAWTGRISRCWTNALIFFFNQQFIIQRFSRCISPEFFSYPFVKPFRKCFSQSISQYFGHNRIVIIMLIFKFFYNCLYSMTGGHSKCSDKIIFWCNKVRQTIIRFLRTFIHSLTGKFEFHTICKNGFIFSIGGVNPNHTFGSE